jgi:hypothetical protein
LSQCGPGLPAAGQRPTGFCPTSSLRWSGETRPSSAAGSASARRASAPTCSPVMPARGASDLTCDTFGRPVRRRLTDLRFHSSHGVILCTNRGRKVA